MRDLVACLRALDADLAAIAPSPRLEARLRESLRSRGMPPWWTGGTLAPIAWPIGFGVAAAAALILGLPTSRSAPEPATVGGDPAEIAREKIHPDAGPDDPAPRRAPPPIHAQALRLAPPPDEAPLAPPSLPIAPSAPPMVPIPRDTSRPILREEIAPGVAPAPPSRPRGVAPRVTPDAPAGAASEPARSPALGMRGLSLPWRSRSPSPIVAPTPVTEPSAPAWTPVIVPLASPPERGPAACLTEDELVQKANRLCRYLGLVPSTYEMLDPCGDGTYQHVDPKCVPPPSSSGCDSGEPGDESCGGPVCFSMEYGDGTTCTPRDSIAQQAADICAIKGFVVADLTYAPGCEGDSAASASFTCCSESP